jgi:hypothetical protein
MNKLHEKVERKFIESFDVSDWEVETNSGWVDIEKSNKTIEYEVWRLELENGQWLECADNHIVFKPYAIEQLCDEYEKEEVFVRDLKVGDLIIVNRDRNEDHPFSKVKKVEKLDRKENMYDLTVGGNHTYFTNDILSHNTMIMGNIACNAIKSGKNVVYISFEITKEHIHQRFTSTFTNLSMQKLIEMREEVKDRIRGAYEEGKIGEFVIAEFPPSSVTALQLDNYLTELKLKKNFSPDLIIVDYLGIMKPIDKNATSNYDKGKEVSENLRWLGYRHECPIVTGSQNNRSAIGEMDVGMESLSDSFGIGMTADLIISITKPETLDQQSQLRFKITKSRMCKEGQFVIIDVDYDKMTLKCEHGGFESQAEEEMKETVSAIRERKKRNRQKDNPDEVSGDGIIV